MKNKFFLFLGVCLFFSIGTAKAQDSQEINLVKVNLTALPLNNFSFQYERAIGKKTTVAMGLRFMPKGDLPLKSAIESLIDDDEAFEQLENLQTGNFALTPEFRYYTGKEAFRGFYIAPFVRYGTYSASTPFEFEFEYEYEDPNTGTTVMTREETIDLDGKLSTLTAGFMIGAQWKLSRVIYLDWWILGPQYGFSNGSIDGQMNLSPEEQEGLREELKELEDLPLVKVNSTVTSEGAKVDFNGPWAGVRAGLSIGYRF